MSASSSSSRIGEAVHSIEVLGGEVRSSERKIAPQEVEFVSATDRHRGQRRRDIAEQDMVNEM